MGTQHFQWLLSSDYAEISNLGNTSDSNTNNKKAVADLGGVPRVSWNPPFGFSCDRKLWKPGLQQNPTI